MKISIHVPAYAGMQTVKLPIVVEAIRDEEIPYLFLVSENELVRAGCNRPDLICEESPDLPFWCFIEGIDANGLK